MNKYKYYLIIICIVMLVPILCKAIKVKHSVTYKIDGYSIIENYYKENGNHHYDFIIKKNKKTYSYTLNKKVNKVRKIVTNIDEYKENKVSCILVSFKANKKSSLLCLKENKQMSNYALRNDSDYKVIFKKVEKKLESYEESDEVTKFKKLKVYKDNILDGYNYYIWSYSGLYVINNKDINYYKFLDYDLYDNIMAVATKRYYVLFENSSVNGIDTIYYYDSKKKKVNTWKLEQKIDKDSYINGVYKDIIYVTDKKKKVQYSFNIKKEEKLLVGNEEKEYIKYVNFEKELFNKSDFLMKEQYFNDISDNGKMYHNNHYVYSNNGNTFYMEMDEGSRILAFNLDKVTNWENVGRDIILLRENTIYLYNEEVGLRKIISYDELKYNNINIYKVGK